MTRYIAALTVAAVTSLTATLAPTTPATAADPTAEGLVVKKSAYSVTETLDRLESMLKENGLTVFTRIDHAKNAANADLDLPPTQVLIFGNPKLGTPLMQASRTAAMDLPQKALAWEDADGAVWLAYNHPEWLSERHGINDQKDVLKKIGAALDNFTAQASSK